MTSIMKRYPIQFDKKRPVKCVLEGFGIDGDFGEYYINLVVYDFNHQARTITVWNDRHRWLCCSNNIRLGQYNKQWLQRIIDEYEDQIVESVDNDDSTIDMTLSRWEISS